MAHYTVRNVSDPPYCRTPPSYEDGTRCYTIEALCYTLQALSGEDLEGRLWHFTEKVPTLRRVTIAYGRCLYNRPHRVITVDLDNMPHTVDRQGQPTDKYWKDAYW